MIFTAGATVRKDFWVMSAHHCVTMGLLSLSWLTGYVRIGIVVLVIHNAFDPFLHAAKCTHYLKGLLWSCVRPHIFQRWIFV